MEELYKNARAYYEAAPEKIRRLANEFFAEMDRDGDRKVKLHEYLPFMKARGYAQMSNPRFFSMLDIGEKGYLQFWDVMALYYIVISGRPFCDGCGVFVIGTFFTCMKCFNDSKAVISTTSCTSSTNSTFNICSGCFQKGSYIHDHKEFLDNFLLLQFGRVGASLKEQHDLESHKVKN